MSYKNLIFLLLIPLLIFSCSDSDDDDNNVTTTFLKKYDNTVWESSEYDLTIFSRINNDLSSPFEMWILADDCFYYEKNILSGYSIIENTENKFECKLLVIEGDVEYIDLITIQVINENLIIEDKYYEGGVLMETIYLHFQKTTIDVDDLPLCE